MGFEKGTTSEAVYKSSEDASLNLKKKTAVLNSIADGGKVPHGLLKPGAKRILKGDLHQWTSKELGIGDYARNTAYAKHNGEQLALLLQALSRANENLSAPASTAAIPKAAVRTKYVDRSLKDELNTALNLAAELYRAYMQLESRTREAHRTDAAYQDALKAHAGLLGRARLRLADT